MKAAITKAAVGEAHKVYSGVQEQRETCTQRQTDRGRDSGKEK